MDQMDKNNELCVKAQSASFNHELKELKEVSKERHIFLFKMSKRLVRM